MSARAIVAAFGAVLLFAMPAAAEGLCPGEAPVPWAGPSLYSGGFHFRHLNGVSASIALFRRLKGLPDLEWPEHANFYPVSWLDAGEPHLGATEDPPPPVEERLRWAADSALSGDLSVFDPYRPRERYLGITLVPLPAIELDLSTAPGTPLDWWLAPAEDDGWSPRQKAVYRLAQHSELVDWLQTAVTASHASWVFEWGFVPTAGAAYAEWRAVFNHAHARWKRGDGLAWAAVALELLPPRQRGAPSPEFHDASPNELLTLHATLVHKVEACAATPEEAAAALALAAPAHAHGAPAALLLPFLSRSPDAASRIVEKGLRRALLDGLDPMPWVRVATALEAAFEPDRFWRAMRIARLVRFFSAKSFDDALAVYDGRPLDAEAEHVLNGLPYRTLARVAGRARWTRDERARVARAALARAWALGHIERAWGLRPLVAETNPELAGDIAQLQKQPGRTARERALVLLILRTPAINLELAGDPSSLVFGWPGNWLGARRSSIFATDRVQHSLLNWWCRMRPRSVNGDQVRWDLDTLLRLSTGSDYRCVRGYVDCEVGRHERSSIRSSNRFDLPEYLAKRDAVLRNHPVLQEKDTAELEALTRVRSAPEALSRAVIQWATSVDRDRGLRGIDRALPEALHLAVRATRWGCPMPEGHGVWSQEAFTLLHRRWGGTAWAARTPYWFGRDHFGHSHPELGSISGP